MSNTETAVQNYDFEGNAVRTLALDNEPWFVGKDIAKALEYKNTKKALKDHVDDEDKIIGERGITPSIQDSLGRKQYPTLITESGVRQLVASSNMPNAIGLCNYLGIEIGGYNNVKKEQRTLLQIMQAFNGEDMQRQYPVSRGKYRVDLYFPKYKLAIECDEFGHSDRPEGYDEDRQHYIENKLGCGFIRYNPDEKYFNIFKVINRIIKYIYK